jgi:hypothetical protein
MKEVRIKRYDHVMRRDDDHIVRKTLDIQEDRRGKRKRTTSEKDMR